VNEQEELERARLWFEDSLDNVKEIAALQAEINTLTAQLTAHHWPAMIVEPDFECKLCKSVTR
jgi:hypothetical protein